MADKKITTMNKFLKISAFVAFTSMFFFSCNNREDITSKEENSTTNSALNNFGIQPQNKGIFYSIYNYLGSGYDVTQDYANENSAGNQIIDIEEFKADFPTRVLTEYPLSQAYVEDYGENAETYSQMITNKIDLSLTTSIPLFKDALTSSFSSSTTSTNKFDAKYIYGSYNLTIKQKRFRFNTTADVLMNYLTNDFKQDLLTLSPQQLVQFYGTHVLLDIYTGAKMDIKFQSETSNQSRAYASRVGIKTGVKDVFNIDVSNDIDISSSSMNYSKKLSYRTRGGDPSKGLVGDLNLDQTNPKINISDWQNSSTADNSVLVDFGQNGLTLIYNLISDPIKKAQVKAYVDQYLIDNQVYLEFFQNPIYSYFNGTDHFYTKQNASFGGYSIEGEAFKAFNYNAPDSKPVYRYYNGRDHFYTINPGYFSGYSSEGIEFNAYDFQKTGTVPIYRFYKSSSRDHYYAKSAQTPSGYTLEGIAFYAY